MERGRWIWDESKQDLVPAHLYHRPNKTRSSLPAPMVIGDTMEEGVQSQLDGKIYTSKSELRKTYRQAGVTEVGNDPQRLKPFKKPKPDRKAIRTSVEKAAARFNNGERTETYRRKHP
jgi:hypothetical protein